MAILIRTKLIGLLIFLICNGAQAAQLPILPGIGGPFSAAASTGEQVSLGSFKGRPVLIAFGYTNCPDVCPVTLSHLATLISALGNEKPEVQVLFVSLDPESDTPEHLQGYLKHFHPDFIGITGTRSEVDTIASLFKVRYERKIERQVTSRYNRMKRTGETFTVYSHSQQIYLLDQHGLTRALYYAGAPIEDMRQDILQLLREQGDVRSRTQEGE